MEKHCNILVKASGIPEALRRFLSPEDVLFTWTEAYVAVDDENDDVPLYSYELEIELIRIHKKVLQVLDDQELSLLLFKAKIERDAEVLFGNLELAIQNSDYVVQNRYSRQLIDRVLDKLNLL